MRYYLDVDKESQTIYLLEDHGDRPTIASASYSKIPLQFALVSLMYKFGEWLKNKGE